MPQTAAACRRTRYAFHTSRSLIRRTPGKVNLIGGEYLLQLAPNPATVTIHNAMTWVRRRMRCIASGKKKGGSPQRSGCAMCCGFLAVREPGLRRRSSHKRGQSRDCRPGEAVGLLRPRLDRDEVLYCVHELVPGSSWLPQHRGSVHRLLKRTWHGSRWSS